MCKKKGMKRILGTVMIMIMIIIYIFDFFPIWQENHTKKMWNKKHNSGDTMLTGDFTTPQHSSGQNNLGHLQIEVINVVGDFPETNADVMLYT